ncbi:unnamed protein product [Calypogeia fissa]
MASKRRNLLNGLLRNYNNAATHFDESSPAGAAHKFCRQVEIHGDNLLASPRRGPSRRPNVFSSRLLHNPRALIETPRMLTFSSYFTTWPRTVIGRRTANTRFTFNHGIGKSQGGLLTSVCLKLPARRCSRSHGLSRISAVDFSSRKETDACDGFTGRSDEEDCLDSFKRKCEKLRCEFEAAQKGFQHIPKSIQNIPKMDPNGVYTNYNLRLDQIKVYGFDYDFTLAHYTEALQPLIYDLAKKHLVSEYRYPESCLNFKYDPDFPIRGLYYDKKHGNLLKLDFFHSVEPHGCFFGRRQLSRPELEAQYGGKHISVSDIPNLVPLMDLFCLSEACLISDVIQHFVDQNMEFDSAYVYEDVKRSIDFVHRSGLMHRTVISDPAKYLVKNDAVVRMLKMLKRKGKKLFILTNSPFPFVNDGMRYLFQEDGKSGDSWRETFDVVLASADKPAFYTSERPFRHYSTRLDQLGFSKVDHFGQHAVYYHGCLKSFLDITKWRGSEVLYCGDHLYTDLRGPAKAGWRTAAIIRELEREIDLQNETEYRIQQAKYNVIQELLGEYHKLPEETQLGEAQQTLLMALRRERQSSRLAMRAHFNQYFGSCFLTDTGKESAFAYNVQRYADIYTSRLENLIKTSSEPWLCAPFDLKSLPHHVKVPPSSFMDVE